MAMTLGMEAGDWLLNYGSLLQCVITRTVKLRHAPVSAGIAAIKAHTDAVGDPAGASDEMRQMLPFGFLARSHSTLASALRHTARTARRLMQTDVDAHMPGIERTLGLEDRDYLETVQLYWEIYRAALLGSAYEKQWPGRAADAALPPETRQKRRLHMIKEHKLQLYSSCGGVAAEEDEDARDPDDPAWHLSFMDPDIGPKPLA